MNTLDTTKLYNIFTKGKEDGFFTDDNGFDVEDVMTDINTIGTIVEAGQDSFVYHIDTVHDLSFKGIPMECMYYYMEDKTMANAWEKMLSALDYTITAYELEYDELKHYWTNLMDTVRNFPSTYLK